MIRDWTLISNRFAFLTRILFNFSKKWSWCDKVKDLSFVYTQPLNQISNASLIDLKPANSGSFFHSHLGDSLSFTWWIKVSFSQICFFVSLAIFQFAHKQSNDDGGIRPTAKGRTTQPCGWWTPFMTLSRKRIIRDLPHFNWNKDLTSNSDIGLIFLLLSRSVSSRVENRITTRHQNWNIQRRNEY